MEKLEKIWHKLNDLEKEIGQLIEKDSLQNDLTQLKKETVLSKKWKPWLMGYVLTLMTFIAWFTAAYNSIVSMAGISLITLGGCALMYFFQKNNISEKLFESYTTLDSLKMIIQEKLKKRMNFWALGMAIFMLSLTFGLHLMIFGLDSLAGKGGELGIFYGIMFGLTGYSVGMIYTMHAVRYGSILREQNTLFPSLKL